MGWSGFPPPPSVNAVPAGRFSSPGLPAVASGPPGPSRDRVLAGVPRTGHGPGSRSGVFALVLEEVGLVGVEEEVPMSV